MSAKIQIGIDPGWSGGFAFHDPATRATTIARMPDSEFGIWHLLRPYANKAEATIELVHAMSTNGCKGNFRLGQNWGALRCALEAFGIPKLEVSPMAWMKRLQPLPKGPGKARTERKRIIRDMMRLRYPDLAKQIILDTADAVAILDYARA
jgi:hypothetical protein